MRMGASSTICQVATGLGDTEGEAGGLRSRGARGGGRDPFQGTVDSWCEKKEGTEGVGMSRGKAIQAV